MEISNSIQVTFLMFELTHCKIMKAYNYQIFKGVAYVLW